MSFKKDPSEQVLGNERNNRPLGSGNSRGRGGPISDFNDNNNRYRQNMNEAFCVGYHENRPPLQERRGNFGGRGGQQFASFANNSHGRG